MKALRAVCRLLLHAYPADFSDAHGGEMVDVVVDRVRHRVRTHGRLRAGVLAVREVGVLLIGIVIARRQAARLRTAGGVSGGRWLVAVGTDVRYTLRGWRRHPGFVIIVIATLALGIGANTAIFSVINGVLLRPLAYADADRLVVLWDRFDDGDRTWVHDMQVRALREEARSLSDVAALKMVSGRILGGARPVHTDVARVSANFFSLLGVTPVIGRTFRPGEDVWGAPWVAVLSYDYWISEFAGDSSVVGRKLIVGFPEMEIVGVLPKSFDYRLYEALEERAKPYLWIPHQINYARRPIVPGTGVAVLARLAPGVSLEEAEGELATLAAGHAERLFNRDGLSYDLIPLQGDVVAPIRPVLTVLLGAVGFVLLIAIANVATLVLARTHYRTHELAIRRSLGASPGRITRQLMTENLVLAMVATGIGVLLAPVGLQLLLALTPVALPHAGDIGIDLPVLAFAAATGLIAGIAPGLAPILQLRRHDAMGDLTHAGRAGVETPRSRTTRQLLVVGQIGLTVALLTGAALMGRGLLRLYSLDPGFDEDGVLTFSAFLMQEYQTPQARNAFFREASEHIAAIPGVDAVGATTALPLSAPAYGPVFRTPPAARVEYAQWPGLGAEPDPAVFEPGNWVQTDINTARPGYFAAAGIPVLAGRDFTEADTVGTRPSVIVDDRLAAALWPGTSAVGQTLWVFNTAMEVRGVVRHAYHTGFDETGRPQLYVPYAFVPTTLRTSMVVRTRGDPKALVPAIRGALATVDPLVPIADIQTLRMIVRENTARVRFTSLVLAVFAAAALLLATLGVYGVLAFSVAQQRRQIAVRLAIGGSRGNVMQLVLAQVGRLVGAGVIVGGAVAVPLVGALEGELLHVRPTDPWALALAGVGVIAVALLGSLAPLRRATAIEPATILRGE